MQPIELHWPGGQHEFALPLGQLRALQDACNAGPEEIFNRIRLGTWRVDDLMGIIRFGLIGGGMDRNEAARLVSNMFDAHGAVEFKLVSLGILQHALFGPDDDTPGKDEGWRPRPWKVEVLPNLRKRSRPRLHPRAKWTK